MIKDRQSSVNQSGEMWSQAMLQDLAKYTIPQHDLDVENISLLQFGVEHQPKKPVGLVIGRFQPLHYGHLYLMKMALSVSDQIIIGIGSANVKDHDNPFSLHQRHSMLVNSLGRETLSHKVRNIVYLNDYEDDSRWIQETLAITGSVDMVVGNNEWVNGIFRDAGLMALEIPLLSRGIYQGQTIREELRNQGRLPRIC